MWRARTPTKGLPFKRGKVNSEGGGLAKAQNEIHQTLLDNVHISSIVCVNGHIHTAPIKFMLDSGAAVSVVNHNIVKHIPITSIETRAVGANGSPLDVTGQINADILLGDFATNQKFIVVRNLAIDCLLGADFLRIHGAILDCGNSTLSFGDTTGVSVPIMMNQRGSESSESVNSILRAESDIEIPGRAIQLLSGRAEATYTNRVTVLTEPTPSLPAHLYLACSLGVIENNNSHPSPVTIFKGMKLGTVALESNILAVSTHDCSS